MMPSSGYRTARRGFRVAHAAPAGGARQQWRGRGCAFVLASAFSGLPLLATANTVVTTGAAADGIAVPSGQQVTLQEILLDDGPGALWARFRFVAPAIGHGVGQQASAQDIDSLCESFALPYLAAQGIAPVRVVISLADRALPFGSSDPEVTQYFEAYRPDKMRCIWEGF